MAAHEVLEEAERDIINEVSKAEDVQVDVVIRSVSSRRPPAVVREAYWQLVSDNRITRTPNGRLRINVSR